jgi:hypothetical protein
MLRTGDERALKLQVKAAVVDSVKEVSERRDIRGDEKVHDVIEDSPAFEDLICTMNTRLRALGLPINDKILEGEIISNTYDDETTVETLAHQLASNIRLITMEAKLLKN